MLQYPVSNCCPADTYTGSGPWLLHFRRAKIQVTVGRNAGARVGFMVASVRHRRARAAHPVCPSILFVWAFEGQVGSAALSKRSTPVHRRRQSIQRAASFHFPVGTLKAPFRRSYSGALFKSVWCLRLAPASMRSSWQSARPCHDGSCRLRVARRIISSRTSSGRFSKLAPAGPRMRGGGRSRSPPNNAVDYVRPYGPHRTSAPPAGGAPAAHS